MQHSDYRHGREHFIGKSSGEKNLESSYQPIQVGDGMFAHSLAPLLVWGSFAEKARSKASSLVSTRVLGKTVLGYKQFIFTSSFKVGI